MLNLLLTLFMMVKTEPKIELQKVQQPIVVEQRQESISSVWYTQRPLDARTQTRNRYLDSVICSDKYRSFASSSNPTIIPEFTYEKVGKLPFDKTNWEVYIAEDWTYFINAWAIVWAATVTNWTRVLVLYVNWDVVQLDYQVTPPANISVRLSIVEYFNLNKWDIITIWVSQSSTETVDVSTRLKTFKTS